jgi:hypothetical protein
MTPTTATIIGAVAVFAAIFALGAFLGIAIGAARERKRICNIPTMSVDVRGWNPTNPWGPPGAVSPVQPTKPPGGKTPTPPPVPVPVHHTLAGDPFIVYGAHCTWWGSFLETSRLLTSGGPIPCCPKCHGLLLEVGDEAAWWKRVDLFESLGHPGYRKIVVWGRGRCFRRGEDLEAAYHRAQANPDPSPGKAA